LLQDGFKGYSSGFATQPQFTTKRDSGFQAEQFAPEIMMNMNEASAFSHNGQQPQLQLSPGGPSLGSNSNNPLSVEELDYDEIADKLRTVDAKMREYVLEDIIYQISKDLFAENLKISPGDSTQKFSEFVEAQRANGKLPKDLEKDVLGMPSDVVHIIYYLFMFVAVF
jgi:hypothetical protein